MPSASELCPQPCVHPSQARATRPCVTPPWPQRSKRSALLHPPGRLQILRPPPHGGGAVGGAGLQQRSSWRRSVYWAQPSPPRARVMRTGPPRHGPAPRTAMPHSPRSPRTTLRGMTIRELATLHSTGPNVTRRSDRQPGPHRPGPTSFEPGPRPNSTPTRCLASTLHSEPTRRSPDPPPARPRSLGRTVPWSSAPQRWPGQPAHGTESRRARSCSPATTDPGSWSCRPPRARSLPSSRRARRVRGPRRAGTAHGPRRAPRSAPPPTTPRP